MKNRLISTICALALICTQFGTAFATDETVETENAVIVNEEVSEQTEVIENENLEEVSEIIEDNEADELESQVHLDIENTETLEENLEDSEEKVTETNNAQENDEEEFEVIPLDLENISYMASAPEPVIAESDTLKVQYSYNNNKFAAVSGFELNKTEYNITLPQNSKYAYVKISAPKGSVKNIYTNWSIANIVDENGNKLIGEKDWKTDGKKYTTSTNSLRQSQVALDAFQDETTNAFIVPIKNENATFSFIYGGKEYDFSFSAKQPRLTSLTSKTTNTNGGVVFVSGAAANNDNGSITETTSTNTVIHALGNISEKFIGASMFMLPNINAPSTQLNLAELFNFTADHGGTIYFLSDRTATKGFTSANGWTQTNNGTTPSEIETSGTSLISPRTFNDYSDVEDFAWSLGWTCVKDNNTRASNVKRASDPGVYGATGSALSESKPLIYAYKKSFEKGDTVSVPGPGAATLCNAIFVVWDDADIIEPSEKFEIKYSSDDENYDNITDKFIDNKCEVELPDNAFYGYVNFELPFGATANVKIDGKIDAKTSDNGYIIPIKNGEGTAYITYENDGDETEYELSFTSKQPSLEIVSKNITDGDIISITGAATSNDSDSILDVADLTAKKPKYLSGISDELLGIGMFMLPISAMTKDGSWISKHGDEDMFSFKSDNAGKVYVLFDTEAPMHSEYELLWNVESGLSATYNEVSMKNVYSYEFEADEVVGIPAPEEWEGNMTIFVKWN